MKDRLRIAYPIGGAVLLLILIIILAVSCNTDKETASNTPIPLSDAGTLYQDAVSAVNSMENLSLIISQTKEIIIGSEAFIEKSQQTVTYEGVGTEHLRGFMEETLSVGSHTVSISELYADGVGYFTVEGGNFCGNLTLEEYMVRYTPAVPLNADLYGSITGFVDADNAATITFTRASLIESWCAEPGAQFISADGTAYISGSGVLTKSVYALSYTQNDAYIRLSTTVEINYGELSPIVPPEDISTYTQIAYLDAPRMLEKACGHLLKSISVTSNYSDSISCQAFGDQRSQVITLNTVNAADWSARIDTTVKLTNSSKLGTVTTLTQTERFIDSIYSIAVEGGASTENTEIDAAAMREYCQDLLVGTIMLPQYINSAELTETEDAYHITLTASEEFAQLISAEVCTTLYQDAQILSRQSQSYATDIMSCYLTVDKVIDLPVASGFQYQGTYTIDALPYRLNFQADQQYELLDDTAYSNINDEAGAQ